MINFRGDLTDNLAKKEALVVRHHQYNLYEPCVQLQSSEVFFEMK